MEIKKPRSKPKIDGVQKSDHAVLWRGAVLEACRWHFHVDQFLLGDGKTNLLDELRVEKIISSYGIARNFNANASTDEICSDVNSVIFPIQLNEKSEACKKLATKLKNKKFTSGDILPLSAASKLLWFRFPARWTMFDTFAANGIASQSTHPRFDNFFETLANRHFYGECARIEQCIPKFEIHASKLIDKYAFLVGLDCKARKLELEFLEEWASHTSLEVQSMVDRALNPLIEQFLKIPLLSEVKITNEEAE